VGHDFKRISPKAAEEREPTSQLKVVINGRPATLDDDDLYPDGIKEWDRVFIAQSLDHPQCKGRGTTEEAAAKNLLDTYPKELGLL